MHTIINAIMLLPPETALDSLFARQCLIHIERRGYELVGILHDWATALVMIRSKEAEVIVLARPEHFEPEWAPRVEFVGDDTQDLTRHTRSRPRNERPAAERLSGPADSRTRRPRLA